jgi:hypothetical protein
VSITNSVFSDNSSKKYSGGIYNEGMLDNTNSTFSGNSAPVATGGAVDNSGTMTITNSILEDSLPGGNCKGDINDGGTTSKTPTLAASCPAHGPIPTPCRLPWGTMVVPPGRTHSW